jgi:hypothetical protein
MRNPPLNERIATIRTEPVEGGARNHLSRDFKVLILSTHRYPITEEDGGMRRRKQYLEDHAIEVGRGRGGGVKQHATIRH